MYHSYFLSSRNKDSPENYYKLPVMALMFYSMKKPQDLSVLQRFFCQSLCHCHPAPYLSLLSAAAGRTSRKHRTRLRSARSVITSAVIASLIAAAPIAAALIAAAAVAAALIAAAVVTALIAAATAAIVLIAAATIIIISMTAIMMIVFTAKAVMISTTQ